MDESYKHDERTFAEPSNDPNNEPYEIWPEVRIFQREVQSGDHDNECGDKGDYRTAHYSPQKLLLKRAPFLIITFGRQPSDHTYQQKHNMVREEHIVLHAPKLILAKEINQRKNIENASKKVEDLHDWGEVEHLACTWLDWFSDHERLIVVMSHRFCSVCDDQHEDCCF